MHNGSYLAFNDNTLYAVIDVNGAGRTVVVADSQPMALSNVQDLDKLPPNCFPRCYLALQESP